MVGKTGVGEQVPIPFKPCRTLKQALVHPKDSLSDLQKANVVYKITCADCPASYVGETKRRLETRLKEHKSAVKHGNLEASALVDHVLEEGHSFDWTGTSVLDQESNLFARQSLESYYIRKQELSLNRDKGNLSPFYDSVLFT